MTDVEIFEIETHEAGGRWPYEQLPERVNAEVAERAVDLIDGARRSLPQLPPIHFDFIRNGR